MINYTADDWRRYLNAYYRLVEQRHAGEVHPYIVTETQFDKSPTRGWMVRTPRYKYVLYDKGKYREQLFDIEADRKERRNLAIEKSQHNVLNQHRALLNQWVEQHKIRTTGREIILPEQEINVGNYRIASATCLRARRKSDGPRARFTQRDLRVP